jgi:UDPglucose 6-dehydrogenase
LTEWNEFRSVDLDLLSKIMRGRVLVDLRNILHASDAAAAGFSYSALGRH